MTISSTMTTSTVPINLAEHGQQGVAPPPLDGTAELVIDILFFLLFFGLCLFQFSGDVTAGEAPGGQSQGDGHQRIEHCVECSAGKGDRYAPEREKPDQ